MSKQDQVLILEPQHELKFVGTFTYPITSYIKLTNPSDRKVGFKIKTTAPKKYCVRPNSGLLGPKESIDIAVSLQVTEFDHHAEKNKHKFMVQTMFVPEGDVCLDSLWKEVNPDTLMGTKLKCVFERQEGSGTGSAPAPEQIANAVNLQPLTSHDDKSKHIGDSENVNLHMEGELQKAANEVKHLRDEESCLRQENLMLKEEIMRLRMLKPAEPRVTSIGQATPQAAMPTMVIIAIIVGMVGIVLGKFIL